MEFFNRIDPKLTLAAARPYGSDLRGHGSLVTGGHEEIVAARSFVRSRQSHIDHPAEVGVVNGTEHSRRRTHDDRLARDRDNEYALRRAPDTRQYVFASPGLGKSYLAREAGLESHRARLLSAVHHRRRALTPR
jgi:hypothetical protein